MNFLYQAAALAQEKIGCADVARHYVKTMKQIKQRENRPL